MKKNKLLLIGWDAADWNIIWPLIAQGKMPALKKIIENGVYGNRSYRLCIWCYFNKT